MMLMSSKVIKLDLNYSCAQHHHFEQQRHYLSPYPDEEAEHFARRLLAWLSLYENKPTMSPMHRAGKDPDVFVQDEHQHFTLWATVDLLDEKRFRRACHLSDKVMLFLSTVEQTRLDALPFSVNSSCCLFEPEQLSILSSMLKSHMSLNVWREDDSLLLTDGEHYLELNLNSCSTIHTSNYHSLQH